MIQQKTQAGFPLGRKTACGARWLLAACTALLVAPFVASAATITVTSPDDTDPTAATTCTLRQAILSMNTASLNGNCANTGSAFGTSDTINFAASALAGGITPGTITLADSSDAGGAVGGMLVVSDNTLTIDGSAWQGTGTGQYPDSVTVARPANATQQFGLLKTAAGAGGSLTLQGLTLRNGDTSSLTGGLFGGVYSPSADLTVIECQITGNKATSGAGIRGGSGRMTVIAFAASSLAGATTPGTVTLADSTDGMAIARQDSTAGALVILRDGARESCVQAHRRGDVTQVAGSPAARADRNARAHGARLELTLRSRSATQSRRTIPRARSRITARRRRSRCTPIADP